MPRQIRFVLPGQPQHVIQRGNNRTPIFFTEENFRFYEEKLLYCCEKYDCEIHAYVLMTNHVHLLITPHTPDGISKVMQSIGRYYVPYINFYFERSGGLWEGRYKASLIDSEAYLFTCMRYIELNPVRAGMVEHPGEYRWSSYRYNAEGKENSLITPHLLYDQLASSGDKRHDIYRQLFSAPLTDSTLREIRVATNKAKILGSDHFIEEVSIALGSDPNV